MNLLNKKTLFLDQGETLGGAERFLIDFITSLSSTDLRVIKPMILGGKISEYQKMIGNSAKIIDFDYPQVRGGLFQKFFISLRLLSSARRLKKIIVTENIGQVFANTPRTIFILWIAKVFLGIKTRSIIMIHDFTIPQFLLKKIAKKADIIIVNSIPTRTIVRQIISPELYSKIRIVENGVNLNLLSKVNNEKSNKLEKILLIGRLDPRKGQMYLLKSAKFFQEIKSDLKFFLVGSSFSQDPRTIQYEKELHKFVEDHQLKNVFFIPEVENPFEAMAGSDLVLALPTEPETFGRVVIEALSLDKPIFVFDQMGPADILRNFAKFSGAEVDNFLIKKNSGQDLTKKIKSLADNFSLADGFQSKGQKFVDKHYSLAETQKRLLNILQGY